MKALVFHGPGNKAWEDKPKPALRDATDAILKITKTTLCRSDLGIIDGKVKNVPDGLILGQEGVGVIEEVGTKVAEFIVGDRVMISYAPPCRTCKPCRREQYSNCENGGRVLGRLIDGTIAEYARVPNADISLHHVPEGVDEGTLLMLKDILPTGFVYNVPNGQIQPGDTVAIFGSGHIGLTALLMSQFHSPAEIIMVDTHRNRLEAAEALGATKLVHATNGDALGAIMKLTGGKDVDVAIVANANVALNSIWKSYGRLTLPLQRVLLMPSRRTSPLESPVAELASH